MGVLKRAETDIPMEVALVGLISKKEASLRCSTKRLCQYEATVSTKQKSTLVASQLGKCDPTGHCPRLLLLCLWAGWLLQDIVQRADDSHG